MHFLLSSAWKDLRRLRRDPVALILWIGVPAVSVALLLTVFGRGGSTTPQGRLLVADEDATFISGALTSAFGQGPLGKMLTVEKVLEPGGRARMDRGGASALLIIPKGFGNAVLRSEPCRIQLITNPSQRIVPKIVEETLSIVTEGVFYLQAIFGEDLRGFTTGPPSDDTVVRVNRMSQTLAKSLDPPLIQLETVIAPDTPKPAPVSMPVLFFPGMLFFSVMLLGMGLSADVWKERACGALRRLGTVPASAAAFLAGKMLSTTLVMALVGAVAVGCGRWMLGMPFVNLGGAVAWVAFFGLFFYSLLMLLQVHVDSQRAANVVSNLIVFPMAMIGGTFFPFEVMPKWMASAGRMTPTGWAVVQLKAILNGKTEPRALALAFAGLATVTVAAYILSLRRLRSFR